MNRKTKEPTMKRKTGEESTAAKKRKAKEQPAIIKKDIIEQLQPSEIVQAVIPSWSGNSDDQFQSLPKRFTGTEYENFFVKLIKKEETVVTADPSLHWLSTSYDRQVAAVRTFCSKSLDDINLLYRRILGTCEESLCEPTEVELHAVPGLPPLSGPQAFAVNVAINNRLTLIQGHAGSGKTVTLLSILYNLVQRTENPIMVCAHTNSVVNYLTSCILKMNLKVVCLTSDDDLTQSPSDLLDGVDVICCTCNAADEERLSGVDFHAILIDDSMQATEPECIVPIAMGCERVVLVGDPLQLRPIIKSAKALERTLFERLVSVGVQPLHLVTQFRMHPSLWFVPSVQYLERSLPSLVGVSADDRKLPDGAISWPNANFPCIFYDVNGTENRAGFASDYVNVVEASMIQKLVTEMMARGISPDSIGVMTQYSAQKNHVTECLKRCGSGAIEVDKVDAFQGREKDVIIISCVRSRGAYGLGSLSYKQRFHLVLTRAKCGLIIVGNSKALVKTPMWKNLLELWQHHGVWVNASTGKVKKARAKRAA